MIEAWGRGIEKVMQACRDHGVPEPSLRYEKIGLWVEFQIGAGRRHTSQPESQPESLRGKVLAILEKAPLGKAEISDVLGQKSVSGQLNKVMRELIEEGVIEYTIPEKPRSRLQKYRLTDAGSAELTGGMS